MADPELASKLARRLESVDEPGSDKPKAQPPPPAPKMPEKVVPNPYVAVDDSVSIDDLIAKAMERREHKEENNNVASPGNITMDEAHVAMATVNGCDSQPDTQPGSPPKRTLADLLAKDQERPPTPPHASSPSDVPAKQSPAPKTTIGELLVKDKQPLSPPPTSKCPIVPVQHHIPKPEVRRKSPEEDGSELERKLAAQRAKKSQAAGAAAAAAAESNVVFSSPQDPTPSPQKPPRTERAGEEQLKDNGLENCEPARRTEELSQNEQLEKSSTEPSQPTVSEPATEKSEEKEVPQSEEKQRTHEQGSPQPDLVQEPAVQSSAQPDQTNEPLIQSCSPGQPEEAVLYSSAQPDEPKEPEPQSSPSLEQPEKPLLLSSAQPDRVKEHILQEVTPTSPKLEPANELKPPPLPSSEPPALGPLSETDLKNLLAEEVKKCKLTKEEMIVIKDMELRKDTARPFSPTKELLELIQHENGIRSPPPIPPPKPQTPSHSRPQSPVVKKFSMPSVAATTELKMFAERQNKSSSRIQKSFSQDNPDELSALLERRTKILQGESVPEMINKKLSLYAEFSEFSRKQIKFFTETFRKYDEDADGFIDFDELKRMMEKLGEAQTHIALKEIIRQVDEDKDGKISLREFFLIFRLAAQNQLGCSQVFQLLADSVDVSKEGVLGAASFFQAKIEEQTKLSRFEQEMKEEQEERKRLEEEKKARREKFLQSKSIFQ